MKRLLILTVLSIVVSTGFTTPKERYVCKVEVREDAAIKVKVNAPHVDRAVKKALKKAIRQGFTPVGDAECTVK